MKSKKKIGIILQGSQKWYGGLEYTRNILLSLSFLPPEIKSDYAITLLRYNDFESDFNDELMENVDACINIKIGKGIIEKINNKLKEIILNIYSPSFGQLEKYLKNLKLDFVFPYNGVRNSYFNSASWIPDFQHKYLPEFFSNREIIQRDKLFNWLAKHSQTIIFSSKTAETDFKKFYPNYSSMLKVMPFVSSPNKKWYEGNPADVQKKYNLPENFFILSNQFWQHKNHLIVLKAMKLLSDKNIVPNIVLTGNIYDYRNPQYIDKILKSIHEFNLSKQVFLLGHIPKFDQIQLLRLSIAIIQPSLFEGWSTIVENAKLFGKKIILSNIPVHYEQCNENCFFFNRNSAEELADIMGKCWNSLIRGPDLFQEKISKINTEEKAIDFAFNFVNTINQL